eukprot:CAMPEP_0116559438 /NCGR_PEP_ID=MMETSP0397-20121206/10396_1 /TAXON_ID=216820 /ORGANISM="Cyclophora tenuis, Strain ECT3854" /LENGTH=74 /DNA_ID=CAMNT_0004085207 /DNA_START=404 /DNA_END=628 /DNA_ORIENTATION=-
MTAEMGELGQASCFFSCMLVFIWVQELHVCRLLERGILFMMMRSSIVVVAFLVDNDNDEDPYTRHEYNQSRGVE